MPVDPTAQATSLIVVPQELTAIEQQNRYGICRRTIFGLTSGKHLTILAVQTSEKFSTEQFNEIFAFLKNNHGVEAMQTTFDATVPDFGDPYRNDLYLTAHLRAEFLEMASEQD